MAKQTKIDTNLKNNALRRLIVPGLLTILLYFSHIIVNAVAGGGDKSADFINTSLFVMTFIAGIWWAIELIFGIFMLNAKPAKKASATRKKTTKAAATKKRK